MKNNHFIKATRSRDSQSLKERIAGDGPRRIQRTAKSCGPGGWDHQKGTGEQRNPRHLLLFLVSNHGKIWVAKSQTLLSDFTFTLSTKTFVFP